MAGRWGAGADASGTQARCGRYRRAIITFLDGGTEARYRRYGERRLLTGASPLHKHFRRDLVLVFDPRKEAGHDSAVVIDGHVPLNDYLADYGVGSMKKLNVPCVIPELMLSIKNFASSRFLISA